MKSRRKYSKKQIVKRRKKSRAKGTKAPTSWIERVSGMPKTWWVHSVQSLITKHSRPTKNPWHGMTDSSKVVADLVKLVQKRAMPKKGRPYDENMRMAAILSYVLALWYLRLHRAKSYDSRRPVRLRQGAYWNRMDYCQALFRAMVDESEDQIYFPGQPWETPFHPYPTDGFFQ